MMRKLCQVMLSLFLFCSMSVQAEFMIKPNAGFDLQKRELLWTPGFGEGHFSETYASGNIYLGALFHQYFGVELGYETTHPRQKIAFYSDTLPVLGYAREIGLGAQSYVSESKVHGINFSATGIFPFLPCYFPNTSVYASAGIAWLKLYLTTMMIQDNNAANPIVQWNSARRSVARFSFGVRQMVGDSFGARVYYQWENTSRLNAMTAVNLLVGKNGINTPSAPTDYFTAHPKNSNMVGLGLFYQMI